MQIFHIATVADWTQAQRSGFYLTSSRGKTLQEEGFIHASRADQWEGVRSRYYADVVEPLVLLVIDTDLLSAEWREDPVGDDTFPHIYGPLNPSAVTTAVPLAPSTPAAPQPRPVAVDPGPAQPAGTSFRQEMYREIFFRILLVLLVMICVITGGTIGRPRLMGVLIGALVGVVASWLLLRGFTSRNTRRLSSRG
ncbi:hypothetical protein BH09ACT11_BH09ACT11_20520 [soil metagenome]